MMDDSAKVVARITEFAVKCSDELKIAEVILNAYLSCRISLTEANTISENVGIAGPLVYWS
jgi:hypothetical protein